MAVTFTSKQSRPLLTMEDVDAWREELRKILIQREELSRRADELQRKLSAAELFVREKAAERVLQHEEERKNQPELLPRIEPPAEPRETTPTTMHDAILQVVRKSPEGLEPRQIAQLIRSNSQLSSKIRESHPNYLYTALARLAVKNQIRKEGIVYKAIDGGH
jgi:hypothetical protein